MAYRGPHVAVTQSFTTTPAAVNVENNPPMAIATAYDVYRNNSLGLFSGGGLASIPFPWINAETQESVTDVVWEDDGSRRYDMFPVTVKASSGGQSKDLVAGVTEDYTVSSTGISLSKLAAYDVAQIANIDLRMPYIELTSGNITAVGTKWTVAAVQDLAAYGIVPGLYVKTSSDYSLITSVVGQEITLQDVITPSATNKVGVDSTGAYLNTITRSTGSFVGDLVQVGDIVRFKCSSNSDEKRASIVKVSEKVLTLQTVAVAKPTSIIEVKECTSFGYGASQTVEYANVERLIGFASLKNDSVAGQWVGKVFTPGVFTPAVFHAEVPAVGVAPWSGEGEHDVIPAYTTPSSFVEGSWDVIPVKGDILVDGSKQSEIIAVVGNAVTVAELIASAEGATVDTYNPEVSSSLLTSFRAVNSDNVGIINRITSTQDIKDLYCKGLDIDDCNELAQMLLIQLALANGVVYGCNVAADDITDYTTALEDSLLQEVYSIALGTTSEGINALLPAHVNEASDPYEARERIAVTAHSQDTTYVLAISGGVTATSGVLTGFNFDATRVNIHAGDSVEIVENDQTVTKTVAIAPAVSGQIILTDGSYSHAALTITVRTNNNDIRASKIAALAVGNRRVTAVWPGWFQATNSRSTPETRMYPPYYLTAAVTGNDSGTKPSQSQTNLGFSIPGLSNLVLDTNFSFRKAQLDIIGGAGVDIMVQDANPSSVIKSRHDLTTDMSSVEFRERSVTKQVDTVAKTYRAATQPYIGKYNINGPQGDRLLQFLKQVGTLVNSKLVKDEICASVTLNSIVRDSIVADKLNWDITVTVYIAGNYYDITLNVVSR